VAWYVKNDEAIGKKLKHMSPDKTRSPPSLWVSLTPPSVRTMMATYLYGFDHRITPLRKPQLHPCRSMAIINNGKI
jgi:hypothetical protein